MAKKKPKTQQEHEAEVIERRCRAKSLADKFFGPLADALAVREISDWLKIAPSEEEFAIDLERMYDATKITDKTETPTPEQVFDLFEEVLGEDEED